MSDLHKMSSNKTVQFEDENQAISLKSPWRRQNILSLDGGGVRGLGSLLVLKRLMDLISNEEQRLDSKSTSSSASPLFRNDIPNHLDMKYLPCHYFDYIAGTSSGGLIAIMLGRLRMTVDDCLKEFDHYDDLLGKPKPIMTRIPRSLFSKHDRTWPLENHQGPFDQKSSTVCKSDLDPKKAKRISRNSKSTSTPSSTEEKPPSQDDEFGPSRCRTIVLCVKLKKGSGGPHAFRSYSLPRTHANIQLTKTMSAAIVTIAQVAKAITTPPTSLKNFDLKKHPQYIDGSLYAQNPTLDVFYEVKNLNEKKQWTVEAIVSVGCRDQVLRRTPSHRSTMIKALSRSTGGVDREMKSIAADKYYRFAWDGQFGEKGKRQSMQEFLEPYAENYFEKYPDAIRDLEEVARKLVKIRRERAETPEWGSFAFGLEYNCHLHSCTMTFYERQALLRHWIWDHGFEHPNPSTTAEFEKKFISSKEYVRLT